MNAMKAKAAPPVAICQSESSCEETRKHETKSGISELLAFELRHAVSRAMKKVLKLVCAYSRPGFTTKKGEEATGTHTLFTWTPKSCA